MTIRKEQEGEIIKTPKKPTTFRLSETTTKELSQLANRHSISQADVIAVIVHCAFMGYDEETMEQWFEMAKLN